MADEEHVKILKQGYKVWNQWRDENPEIKVNLVKADLSKANLTQVDFGGADLSEANLKGANLGEANLWDVELANADLRGTDFRGADLFKANLKGADLRMASFHRATLHETNLSDTNMTESDLRRANLSGACLTGSKLTHAKTYATNFGTLDLRGIQDLEYIKHMGPSTVGTDTLILSKGKIPEVFLRGCGLNNLDIEYAKIFNPDLSNEGINKILYKIYDLRASQALQISPLFISYSHGDSAFVDNLEKELNKKGIRFWRDIHDMMAGKIETQIDRAIRQNPTILLILSKNSMSSDWVQHEVRKARDLEKELGRDALCPIALDDGWKSSRWPQRVMEQVMEYNILDFSKWEDESTFNAKFAKLLNGLDLFYKKPEK